MTFYEAFYLALVFVIALVGGMAILAMLAFGLARVGYDRRLQQLSWEELVQSDEPWHEWVRDHSHPEHCRHCGMVYAPLRAWEVCPGHTSGDQDRRQVA